MDLLSRRVLLQSGLKISASSLVLNSPVARAITRLDNRSPEVSVARATREKLLFDFGWKFQFGHGVDPARDLGFGASHRDFAKTGEFKFAVTEFDDSKWKPLNLPHDWAVELPFVNDPAQKSPGFKPLGRSYPETSIGWYRRKFNIPVSDLGRRITIEFDGIFRSALIFVNGCFIGRNDNGYTPFRFDLTDFLKYGEDNCIVIRVDATFGDGWFYEGAGIYRHVWLIKTNTLHLKPWESAVRSRVSGNDAILTMDAIVDNQGSKTASAKLNWQVFDGSGKRVATVHTAEQFIPSDGSNPFTAEIKLTKPALWSITHPHLYSAVVNVISSDIPEDSERIVFGIRTVVFDANKGFFLNGEPLKIQGTCNHQDHAGVGTAMPDRLQSFRLNILRDMGCNAVRSSHNMPTPEWVEACDRLGVMMMCETRQMSSNPEGLAQFETMIKRYRNSPSIILWSIGNEERALQSRDADLGSRIAATMVRRAHELDPTRPVSAAVNSDNEKGVSEALDIIGFNYYLEYPDNYHKKHPDRALFGSEDGSAMWTRGTYTTDKLRNTVAAYDSREMNAAEVWWKFYATREWQAGGFGWTGFDYRGEPTPYGWPSISSQFGAVDMCGFPKDSFYYYKSWWQKDPVLHLFPHWNFAGREGDSIPVWVYSNLDEVELFLNGKSLGKQEVPHLGHLEWKVNYESGFIEAIGTKAGKVILKENRVTTGPPVTLRVTADRNVIAADGEDLAILRVEALDQQQNLVPTASNLLSFKVSGAGALIGVGNGDPNCQESDKGPTRSLFNGLAQLIIQSTKSPGEITIEIAEDRGPGPSLVSAKLVVQTEHVPLRPAVGELKGSKIN